MNEHYILENKSLLKLLPFYNVLIDFIKQPKVKALTNVELLGELPFYKSLSVKEISEVFKRYARSFRIEIVDKKDRMIQLYSSKKCISKLFGELLGEMKGFKYQITLFVTLKKDKLDSSAEYVSVYLNSFIKTVINDNFVESIDKCFSEILFRLDNWINEGSGWVIETVNDQYLNISRYAPLFGSSFIELPEELSSSKKGLINLRNSDSKGFLWCHVRHLNPVSDHSSRIKRVDKKITDMLDYDGVSFPVRVKDVGVIEDKNEICVNVFSYESKIVCPIYVRKKEYDDCLNVLMIHEGDKSHHVYVKDFLVLCEVFAAL